MDARRRVDGPTSEVESELVDLTGFTFDQLDALCPSALADSLRYVLAEDGAPTEPYAGFQSVIDE